jgi:homocysteine S-methyltransferase
MPDNFRYQCSFEAFAAARYSHEQAIDLMRRAVHIAAEARSRFLESRTDVSKIEIALSLGPFGASALSPSEEFTGVYPPPYGPRAHSGDDEDRNTFNDAERTDGLEEAAVQALSAWHLDRLRVFATDATTWNAINLIAFETIPLETEVRGIRAAMTALAEVSHMPMKEWWISGNFPSGRRLACPDSTNGVAELVKAAYEINPYNEIPKGIGINCTSPSFIPGLVEGLEREIGRGRWRPWLVLYPNGGGVYDPIARTWGKEGGESDGSWADDLIKIVNNRTPSGIFPRVVVGGCCKTGPTDIETLAKLVQAKSGS